MDSVDYFKGLYKTHILAGWAMAIQSSTLDPFKGGIKFVISFSSDLWK